MKEQFTKKQYYGKQGLTNLFIFFFYKERIKNRSEPKRFDEYLSLLKKKEN